MRARSNEIKINYRTVDGLTALYYIVIDFLSSYKNNYKLIFIEGMEGFSFFF